MLISSLIFLLVSNSIAIRRDNSLLYSRITILIWIFFDTIGIYGGLFSVNVVTLTPTQPFILINAVIDIIGTLYIIKVFISEYNSVKKLMSFINTVLVNFVTNRSELNSISFIEVINEILRTRLHNLFMLVVFKLVLDCFSGIIGVNSIFCEPKVIGILLPLIFVFLVIGYLIGFINRKTAYTSIIIKSVLFALVIVSSIPSGVDIQQLIGLISTLPDSWLLIIPSAILINKWPSLNICWVFPDSNPAGGSGPSNSGSGFPSGSGTALGSATGGGYGSATSSGNATGAGFGSSSGGAHRGSGNGFGYSSRSD